MKIQFHKRFEKRFQRLPPHLKHKATEAINRFMTDPFHPLLRNHALTGRMNGKRAFYVSANVRIIFEELDGYTLILLLDIGSHEMVYR